MAFCRCVKTGLAIKSETGQPISNLMTVKMLLSTYCLQTFTTRDFAYNTQLFFKTILHKQTALQKFCV